MSSFDSACLAGPELVGGLDPAVMTTSFCSSNVTLSTISVVEISVPFGIVMDDSGGSDKVKLRSTLAAVAPVGVNPMSLESAIRFFRWVAEVMRLSLA